jgi:hypothetical protein
MLDDDGAIADANEPGASVVVHHGLVRLIDAGQAPIEADRLPSATVRTLG